MGVSGDLDEAANWTDGLGVRAFRSTNYMGSNYHLALYDEEAHGTYICGIETGETYYVVLGRQGTNRYVRVYTNSDYSGEPYAERTLTVEDLYGPGDTTFQYIYLMTPSWATPLQGTYQITDVVLENATEFTDNVPAYALGAEVAFDHEKPPAGTMLRYHNDRLFIADGTDNRLYYSQFDEPYYFPADHFISVGDRAPITGFASWRGQLVVLKETSTWAVSGYGEGEMRVEALEPGVGGIPSNVVASGPPGVLWAGREGLWLYDGTSINRVVPFGDMSPWSSSDVTSIAFHNNRFYVTGPDDTLAVFHPGRGTWRRLAWEDTDGDGDTTTLRAVNAGDNQTHIITRAAWASGGSQEITVLHPVDEIANADGEGTSHSALYAPVSLTFLLPHAPAGYEMIPMAVWLFGEWEEHATASKRPHIFLNTDASYSDTAGDNAWSTTPEAPQGGEVIGVPNGYYYGVSSAKTNAARRWYLQIEGEWAQDFRLEGFQVEYRLRRARGA
jgi:hypothetical protein